MHYKFPILRTIDDVLPHIEGRPEFIVAERPGYVVINYAVAFPDSFTMTGPDDLGGAVRRECRGLIFDTAGKLISRPFHKFFNLGEKDETRPEVIDLTRPHVIMEKMDGSMIRPIWINNLLGGLRLATKMGVTDVAEQAEAWLLKMDNGLARRNWISDQLANNKTPLFEWVSPNNQIVLVYEEADLVLTAVRDNLTGEYTLPLDTPFNTVPLYGSITGNIETYIERARAREDREGDIIRFDDGHMLKSKNDWYVRIHKTIDRVSFDRHIVSLILNEELDDAIGMLPKERADYVRAFEAEFWYGVERTIFSLEVLVQRARDLYDGNKKRVALEMVPTLGQPDSAKFIFNALDGKAVRDLVLDHVTKQTGTNVKWDAAAEWLGMTKVGKNAPVEE